MSKHIRADISKLLTHTSRSSEFIYKETTISYKDIFALNLNMNKNIIYKAYGRFDEIKIQKGYIRNLLLNISNFIKESRLNRQFEIYLYNNTTEELFHYYLRKDLLEKLPILIPYNSEKLFFNNSSKKIELLLIITLLVQSIPKTNKGWWYKNNIIQTGVLTEKIANFAKKNKQKIEVLPFYDSQLNDFINIQEDKESVIQTIQLRI